ncbi:ribonuclease HII [Parafannyhessea umbonata]|uniref:ribonuclease HII n=1 Tax=Parafannyhessea umbonata TaxID=604330 RepID=UPI00359C62B1
MSERVHPASAREVAARLSDAGLDEIDGLLERYGDDPRKQVQHAVAVARRRRDREAAERDRVSAMYDLQHELGGDGVVLGVDEVGRGAIAGPLTVCAVALPANPRIWGLNDSKQLTPARREALAARIAEVATAIGIAHIEPASIDAVGMSSALRMAMANAIEDTGVDPDCVLIDGNPVHVHPREKTLVKGDARVACIAAASIVAKVTRDAIMVAYDAEYPEYHLAECKGYGSAAHIEAIRQIGLSPIHRVSFCGNFLETPSLF